MIMRLRLVLHAIARHRILLFALAFALALALPATALCQDGASAPVEPVEPVETADDAAAADPAAAGDLELTDADVQAIQETLKDLGYYVGPADGRRGPRTRTALRNFQRDQGLAVTGSLDVATLKQIDDQSRIARTEHRPEADAAAAPATTAGGGGDHDGLLHKTGDAIGTGVGAVGTAGRATGRAVGTAGRATGIAGATAGKATARAGATAGKATARAGVVTYNAGATAGKATAHAGVFVYNQGRRAIMGDHRDARGDDDIRAAIERQYAEEDRIVPGEIQVRVARGDVTLTLPDGARSDVEHAVRIARLTTGVKTVTTVYTSVDEQP
jgi:peptidoglycan hydrolase-like protein with peptidoglycan-binding domain